MVGLVLGLLAGLLIVQGDLSFGLLIVQGDLISRVVVVLGDLISRVVVVREGLGEHIAHVLFVAISKNACCTLWSFFMSAMRASKASRCFWSRFCNSARRSSRTLRSSAALCSAAWATAL